MTECRRCGQPLFDYSPVDLSNLQACIRDAQIAAYSKASEIILPHSIDEILDELAQAVERLPSEYRERVGAPFLKYMQNSQVHGLNGFEETLVKAILYHDDVCYTNDLQLANATRAAQELIGDLWDKYLEEETNAKAGSSDLMAPLFSWSTHSSAAIYPAVNATMRDLDSTVALFPIGNARRGVLTWASFAHEVTGHNVLTANTRLIEELKTKIFQKISNKMSSYTKGSHLATYWSDRVNETVSDILGIMNMGPTRAIGIVGYLKAMNGGELRSQEGNHRDLHPLGILRGFLAARVMKKLPIEGSEVWSQEIKDLTSADYPKKITQSGKEVHARIRLDGKNVKYKEVAKSIRILVNTVFNTKLNCLNGKSLGEIRVWNEHDELEVHNLRKYIKIGSGDILYPASNPAGYYAQYVVSAAVMESLGQGANLPAIFQSMVSMLVAMNRFNPDWKEMDEICVQSDSDSDITEVVGLDLSSQAPLAYQLVGRHVVQEGWRG